jgi:hypothetical protein
MLPDVIPSDGIGKERPEVSSLSHLYVSAHLDEMLNLSASSRLAPSTPSPARGRLTSAIKGAWSLLSGPADRPMQLPAFTNLPYRG